MKKQIFTLVIVLVALFARSQSWEKNLSPEKLSNGSLNFFDVKKAFYDFCKENNVKENFYLKNGERQKLSGYKQFKRWEYNMSSNIDPVTGEFPSFSAADIIKDSKTYEALSLKSPGKWENIGISDNKRVGRVNCIAFHPDIYDIIYAGTPSGGLWKTTDHGETWTCLTNNFPGLGVSAIVIIPKVGGDIIYIGTGDRDYAGGSSVASSYSVGVLKSNNGGATWEETGLSFNSNQLIQVTGLVKHPINDNLIYATTTEGLFKTTDGGKTWPNIFNPALNNNFIDIELSAIGPQIIFVSTRSNEEDSTFIFRSLDSGNNWDIIFREYGSRTEMAVSTNPGDPKWLYAVVADMDENGEGCGLQGVYRFLPMGTSYSKIINGNTMNILGRKQNGSDIGEGQGDYDLSIAVDPNNGSKFFIGGINMWKWEENYPGPLLTWETWDDFKLIPAFWKKYQTHVDKHQLIFRPGTSELYECNDGGIFKRISHRDWEGLSEGMAISQMYRLGLNKNGKDKLLTGLQDNGTHEFKGTNWNKIHHSDGMECLIDYKHPNTQYASSQNGSIVRTKIAWWGIGA
jgi:hypothetical protein